MNPILVLIGVGSIGSGAFQLYKASRNGMFFGRGGFKYHQDRNSLFYWVHLLLLAALIPGGAWLVWLGLYLPPP